MALFKMAWRFGSDIVGQPAKKWSTTTYVDAATAVQTAAFGVSLWINVLRSAARNRVWCYEVYAADLLPTTEEYTVQGVPDSSQRGTISTTGLGEPYKPEICIAVTLPVPGSRPSRKFWRPGLYEGDVINGVTLDPTLVGTIESAFNSLLTTAPELRDPDNQSFLGPVRTRLSSRELGRQAGFNVPAPPTLPA